MMDRVSLADPIASTALVARLRAAQNASALAPCRVNLFYIKYIYCRAVHGP